MKREIGYPLPDGDAFTEEMECAIIYYPAKAEYRQALLGSVSFLATWRAWERDTDKRGKDAADAWRLALELTMGCWNMACIETLIENQEFMLEWMATHSLDCCEGTTYGDTTIITTIIIPFVGDPPDYYGETAISDWDDWAEHVCFNANAWVDILIENALVLEEGLLAGGVGMGMLAYVLAGIAFIATGGLLAIPVIMLGAASLLALEGSGTFSDAADDLETGRDDIVCALLNGLDVGQAVEDAIGSGLAWTTVFSLLNYDTPTAIIYEGGGQDSYLSSETDDSCFCPDEPELNGWYLFNTEGGPMVKEFASWCANWESNVWQDFHKPDGSPNKTGVFIVGGYVRVTGDLHTHGDCTEFSRFRMNAGLCYDWSPSRGNCPDPLPDIIYNNQTTHPWGEQTLIQPFEISRNCGATGTLSIQIENKWYFGHADVNVEIVVTKIIPPA